MTRRTQSVSEPSPDSLQFWAKVTRELQEARKEVLSRNSITEKDLDELHDQAMALMQQAESIATEFGIVQAIIAKPVKWKERRLASGEEPFTKRRLILLRRTDEPE